MASYITNYGSDELLNWGLNSSGMWLALASGYVSGVFEEVASGLGYARIFVSGWAVNSGYASPNVSGVNFGPAVNSGWVVTDLGIYDAEMSGNLWWAGSTNISGTVNIGQFASFGSGDIVIGFQSSGA